MAVRLNTVSAMELKLIFNSSELETLVEMGEKCQLWQDGTGDDSKISLLFSRVQIKAGMRLTKHLEMQKKIFPISKHPGVWMGFIQGPVQKELLASENGATGITPVLIKEKPKQKGGTSRWYSLGSAITNWFHALVSALMNWWVDF